MSKKKAFLIHFCISLLIVSTCISVIFVLWYPGFYFYVFDAAGVLKVLVGVDLVLGPLLTLIVFKHGKPGLHFDLSVIAVLQLSALIYGMHVAYTERPYFTVFAIDRFEVLTRQDVNIEDVSLAMLENKPWVGPAIFVARLPTDLKERHRVLEETLFEGKPDIQKRPEFWATFDDAADDVFSKARPINELLGQDPESIAQIEALIAANNEDDNLVYLPIMGKQDVFSLVLDPVKRLPLGLIDLDPWEIDSELTGAVDSSTTG
jgi:hypothetical protein